MVDKIEKHIDSLNIVNDKFDLADPDDDIIFIRKFKKSTGEIIERLNTSLLILKEGEAHGE